MRSRLLMIGALVVVASIAMACSSGGASASPSAAATASPAAASDAPSDAPPASDAPSSAPPAASGATVEVGTFPDANWLVAGSNDMTVYIFTKDTKDSGTSVCTGGCLETWPALTVPAGTTPTGGTGVTGALGTITRADDGSLQVTYNGLPLYFFKNDKAPGDTAGIYENWEAVAP